MRWDDAKGFGFIRSGALAQDVFVHVRDYRSRAGEAPRAGLRVTFDDIHVGGKGPRAVAVQPLTASRTSQARDGRAGSSPSPRRENARRTRHASPRRERWAPLAIVMYGLALTWLVWHGQLPWWVIPVSVFLNMATFLAYWQDKHAARNGHWRISEATLHLWSLAGGWGGAWFAQQVLRHKSVKASFAAAYRASVMIHCAAAAAAWWVFRVA